MAGTIIVDKVQLDVGQDTLRVLANTGSTIFTANTLGINAASLGYGTVPVAQIPQLTTAKMPTGSVLQVVQTVKSDTFSAQPGQNTWVDITGLSVSITPTSATSKILVFIDVAVGHSTQTTGAANVRLVRNSTPIYIGDAAGSRARSIASWPYEFAQYTLIRYSGVYLDSPATTSPTTYKYQISGQSASYTVYVNRTHYDNDRWEDPRVASSITVMEIAG
jgi:hypothetical protein